MRYLLDTNTCIAVMRNHPAVVGWMRQLTPDDCSVSTITSYELYTGVEKCREPAKERLKVELFLETVGQLPFDEPAALESGRLRAILESRGMMIGPYDVLLAGHALAAGLILVTANTAEFSCVPGWTLENWQLPTVVVTP